MTSRARSAACAGVLACVAVAVAVAAATPGASPARGEAPVAIAAALAPSELPYGSAVSVSGRVSQDGAPLATAVQLQADPYPYRAWQTVAEGASAADGSYALTGYRPQQNTRLRVAAPEAAGTLSAVLQATVDPVVSLAASDLGPGRERLGVRVRHAPTLASPAVSAYWYLAARGATVFRLAAVSATSELPGGVTVASALVDPPARRFRWRVCVNPAWEAAMGPAESHGRCPQRGFRLADAD